MDLRLRHEEPLISLYYMSLSILEIWGFCVRSHNHLHHNNHTYEICINMNLVHWKRHVLLCNFGRTSLSHKVLTLVLQKEKKLYALQVLSASSWRISNQGSGAIALIVGRRNSSNSRSPASLLCHLGDDKGEGTVLLSQLLVLLSQGTQGGHLV